MNKPFIISVELNDGSWLNLKHPIVYNYQLAVKRAKEGLKNMYAKSAFICDINGNEIHQMIKP